MASKTVDGSVTFGYFPGFLPMVIGFAVFCSYYGLFRLIVIALEHRWLLSLKGVMALAIGSVGNVYLWYLTVKLWRLHWRFTFTPTHLIAVHRLRGRRVQVPWEAIATVRKLPRPWWARGGGGLGISVIETSDGRTIAFMTHLMLRYEKFLTELQARAVNCREFDPYWSEWER